MEAVIRIALEGVAWLSNLEWKTCLIVWWILVRWSLERSTEVVSSVGAVEVLEYIASSREISSGAKRSDRGLRSIVSFN